MPLNKKSELENDWIAKQQGKGESNIVAFSLNELDMVTHQQVPAYRYRRTQGSKIDWRDTYLLGGTIQGARRYGHDHTDEQLSNLRRVPAALARHVRLDHYDGDIEDHDSYH